VSAHQESAEHLAGGDTDREDHRIGAERAGAPFTLELQLDDRQHLRGHQRCGGSLKGSREYQRRRGGRESACQGGEREGCQAEEERAPGPEHVA
jgi:hypothetical protein